MWNYLIDDHVPRGGYYWVVNEDNKDKDLEKRSLHSHVVNFAIFFSVVGYVWYLWGWKAAILYLIFPTNVGGWAWVTGGYYMTTVLLCLGGYAIASTNLPFTHFVEVMFYWAALESTVTSFGWIIYRLVCATNLWLLIPFLVFINGKRFAAAIIGRHKAMSADGVTMKVRWGSFLTTIPYYMKVQILPTRLGFFHDVGISKEWYEKKFQAAGGMLLCVGVLLMWLADWRMAVMWVGSVIIFSQVLSFGQYWSERYTHIGNVAWCVVMAKVLPHDAFLIYATWLGCLAWQYIPAWKDNGNLFSQGVRNFPKQKSNYINLSIWYVKKQMFRDALKPLLCALHLAEGDKTGIYINLANVYANLGETETALQYTELAIPTSNGKDFEKLIEQRKKLTNQLVDERKNNAKKNQRIVKGR